MEDHLDKAFDEKFKKVNSPLIWLPWVGQSYSTAHKKLIIVGESHHDSPGREGDLEFADCIRWFVQSVGIDFTDNPQPFIRNTEKAIFGKNLIDNEKIKLWDSVVYHIMVQRILESIQERPNDNDFINAWNLFFQIVEIIKPNFCLFCGVTSANFNGAFIEAATRNNYKAKNIQAGASVDNVALRVTEVFNDDGLHLKIIFVRHPSQFFKWTEWKKLIDEEINEYTSRLTGKTSS